MQKAAAQKVSPLSRLQLATFVFQVKAGVGDGTVAAERQVHGVGAALDSLGQLTVLEATNQRAVAIRAVVDVQEVVVWLNVEAAGMKGGRKKEKKKRVGTSEVAHSFPVLGTSDQQTKSKV